MHNTHELPVRIARVSITLLIQPRLKPDVFKHPATPFGTTVEIQISSKISYSVKEKSVVVVFILCSKNF